MIRFGNILLRENSSYMIFNEDRYEILESFDREEMIYPHYSESDIKITQWKGGQHYYAKLGNMTVVDEDGNQKWDSFNEAYKQAKMFLSENN